MEPTMTPAQHGQNPPLIRPYPQRSAWLHSAQPWPPPPSRKPSAALRLSSRRTVAGPRSGTARPAVRTSTGMRSPPSHHYTYASSWIHRSSKPEATIPPSIATREPRARSSQSRCQQQRPPITLSLPPRGPSSPSIVFPSARQSK